MSDIFLAQADIAKAVYTVTLGDGDGVADASVRLGALEKTDVWVPNINAGKWGDEAWLNLNPKWFKVKDGTTQDFKDSCAEVTTGDVRIKSWVLNKSVLEYAVCFSSMPEMKEIRLELQDSGGLEYYLQPELTEEEKTGGHVRPDNVVGSFAVYYNKANNEYRTGKFAHLYRWECLDAGGKRQWCGQLAIDDGDLVIPLPVAWLEKATYPVICMGAGDTLGYTSQGDSNYGVATIALSSHDTMGASAGTTSDINIAFASGADGSRYVKTGVWTDDTGNNRPETLLGSVVQITPANGATGFRSAAYEQNVSASAKYWLAWGGNDASLKIKYDGADANRNCYVSVTSPASDNLPSTWPNTGNSNNTTRWSLYVNYSTAGGNSIPAKMHHYLRN